MTKSAIVWVDGGSRGNPGRAGSGMVIEVTGGSREEHCLFLGLATNNVAEYAALLAALERAVALDITDLAVYSDSELLVKQMNGAYRVKARHLVPLWLRARELARGFTRFRIAHTPRSANAEADRLANRAMDTGESTVPRPQEV